jgi:uncharacterized protein involved in exopolysaccharide biosynthesis
MFDTNREGANMEHSHEGFGMRDVLTILFKHKSRILVIFFGVVLTITIVSFLMVPIYEARSTLLVKIGREHMYYPETGSGGPMPAGYLNQELIMNSEIAVLESKELIEKVIRTIGVENIYPALVKTYRDGITPTDKAILAFEHDLNVGVVGKSNVIEVSYRHADRRMAAKAVNVLVELFKEKHLQVYHDRRSSLFESQSGVYRNKLKGSEDALQQFKQRNRVYSLEDQRRLLLEQRVKMDGSYKESLNNSAELRQRLSTLNEKTRSMSNYTSSERDRIITDANLKLLFQELEKEKIRTEADLRAQREKSESIKQQLAQMDTEIRRLDLAEKNLFDLKRELAVNEKNYQSYMDKSEDARILDIMNLQKLANISTVQGASDPVEPIKPRKGLNVVLSIVLGAVAGLSFAFFSEHSSQGLTSSEAAEQRLKLHVLATVPKELTA